VTGILTLSSAFGCRSETLGRRGWILLQEEEALLWT
jgi:hypothetical protein